VVKLNRRKWLQLVASLAVASNFFTKKRSQVLEIPKPKIELRGWTPDGKPLDDYTLQQLYFLDLNDEPLPPLWQKIDKGKLISLSPSVPFAIALRLPVDGFGNVALYADNDGRGYSIDDFPLNLNLAFARSRLHRVQTYLKNHREIDFPESVTARLHRAKRYLENGLATKVITAQISWFNLSLVESLWAGEVAVFSQAQQTIAKHPSRPNFLFGANCSRYSPDNQEYNQQFRQLFNFATVPLYWESFEPKLGQKNFARVDSMVQWLNQNQIVVKGHPLVYFHDAGTPDWIKDKSYEEVKPLVYQHAFEIVNYYRDKINYYDIINEANNIPWANSLQYDRQQFLELTRIASEAAIAANPQVKRIINHCCLWGENVAYGKPPQDSVYQYLRRCLDAGIDFEIIGLQVYYPDQDMFEIDRLLERFATLEKPIHITELGVSSAATIDEDSHLQEPRGLWHKPWSEAIQADWIEQFYTLCYSKPYIKAISWWDLADGGSFWPHGGLLHPDMQPKVSFYRLQRLIKKWQRFDV
jgi:GH35 family endo-1,4-beta-xylanase